MAARLTAYIVFSIVGLTLIAGLIVGAQRDTNGPVDLIIVNGRVFPADGGDKISEAVAVQGNKILRVGSNREIQRLQRAQTTVVDAHGGSVLPGFNDAHVQFIDAGVAARQVDLLDARTIEAVREKVRTWAEAHPDEAWVTGHGWRADIFADGSPTRQALDALVPDRPAYLIARDRKTGWANTAALKLAGITRRTPDPANGTIVRDPKSHEATGALKGAAMGLVGTHLRAETREDRLDAIREATTLSHRFGVTSIQHAGATVDDLELYDELRRGGDLRVRVYAMLAARADASPDELDLLDRVRERFPDDPLLKTGALELSDEMPFDAATLDRVVADLERRGWQLIMDAPDETGAAALLDAIEGAGGETPQDAAAGTGGRHRLSGEGLDAADAARLERLDVVASVQPLSESSEAAVPRAPADAIGFNDTARTRMLRSLSHEGGRLVFGTNWPESTLDPRVVLEVVAAQDTSADPADVGSEAGEPLTLARAIEAYTRDAAWASFDEHRKGTLTADMLADIVVLSKDVFALPPGRIAEAEIAFTIFDGKVVYEREVATTER